MRVYRCDGDGEVDEFLVCKIFPNAIVHIVGHAASHEIRHGLRPFQSRSLPRAEDVARFAPDRDEMKASFGLSDFFPLGDVQIETKGAAVHLRRADIDEVLEAWLKPGGDGVVARLRKAPLRLGCDRAKLQSSMHYVSPLSCR